MSGLKDKLNLILDEKQDKIIPENIRYGTEIFDITGVLQGTIDNRFLVDFALVDTVVQNFGRNPTTSSITYTTTDDYDTLYIICAASSGDNDNTAESDTITLTASKSCIITKVNEESHFSKNMATGTTYSNAAKIALFKINNVESGTVFTMSSYQQYSVSKSMQIFTASGVDSSDGDATSSDIVLNKIAYVNGQKITGNLTPANYTNLDVTPMISPQSIIPNSPYTGFNVVNISAVTSNIDANISAENIKNRS